jgi:hypothetical protein
MSKYFLRKMDSKSTLVIMLMKLLNKEPRVSKSTNKMTYCLKAGEVYVSPHYIMYSNP